MGIEIERKFLTKGDFIHLAIRQTRIRQAYFCVDPDKVIRLRISDDNAFLTFKSRPVPGTFSRKEWEYNIPVAEAEEMFELCLPGLIDKTRYIIPEGKHFFEVDVFHGRHEGLIVAEIELSSEQEDFIRPDWLGEEVTGDPRYYNSNLIAGSTF